MKHAGWIGTLVVGLVLAGTVAPAAAEYRHTRPLALAPGGTFLLDSDVGSIWVSGETGEPSVAIASFYDDFDRRYAIEFDDRPEGTVVRIRRRTAMTVNSWISLFQRLQAGVDSARIVIRVPPSTSTTIRTRGGAIEAARLGNVRLVTSGGRITVDTLQGGADLRTSGGSINARDVRGTINASVSGGGIWISRARGDVNARNSGGGIVIDGVAGDLAATTSGGGIRVDAAAGRVDAHTSGGTVAIGLSLGNARGGDVSTSGGGVIVRVDPRVPLSIEASSSSAVIAEVPVTIQGSYSQRNLRGTMNGGGELLRLRSSGGGVHIGSLP